MSTRAAFLDTGILIAFLDRTDRYHSDAVGLFAAPPRRWCTSLGVVAEAYGWFLHRLGEDSARRFRLLLADLQGLDLLSIDRGVHDLAVTKLEKLRGHKLTYIDASSLVLIGRHRIDEVWGTDRDLALEGARIVPIR
jgi:predicted nucleic acid-binding protein